MKNIYSLRMLLSLFYGLVITILTVTSSPCVASRCFFSMPTFSDQSITGNGDIITQNHPLADQLFDSIDLNSEGEVQIQVIYEPQAANISITTDSNLLQYIEVYVKDKTLYISKKNKNDIHFSAHAKQKIVVTTDKLQSFIMRGACDTSISYIKAESFSIKLHGAGDIDLSGHMKSLTVATQGTGDINLSGYTKNLIVDLKGAGNVNAKAFNADEVKISIFGTGDVIANATKKINANIYGTGSIKYSGNPKNVEKLIIGAGEIIEI